MSFPSEGVPPAGGYDFENFSGPERVDEIATVVQDVDYGGDRFDEAAALGGYTQQKQFRETAAKVGWMWKRGGSKEKSKVDLVLEGRRKNWSKRWFVVEGTNLLYYSSPNDRQMGIPPKGKVVLNDFMLQRAADEVVSGEHKFCFMLASSTREFLLGCDADAERGTWTQYLQSILDQVTGKVSVTSANIDKAAEHYRQGNKHLLDAQDPMAIAEYTASIGLNPAYEDAYYNRGIAYLNTGCNAKLAITDFTQVIKMNAYVHHEYQHDLRRAYIFRTMAYHAPACCYLFVCTRTCSSAYNNRGISYKQLGKTLQAVDDYRKCLEIDPSDEYARKNLELCEEEEAAKSKSLVGIATTVAKGVQKMSQIDYGTATGDMAGYVYRQTPQHFFAKRYLTLRDGILIDNQDDQLLRGFTVEVGAIRKVMGMFDEPYASIHQTLTPAYLTRCAMLLPHLRYCSTVPECEFQLMFGRQLIRLRTLSPEARHQWVAALGGER